MMKIKGQTILLIATENSANLEMMLLDNIQ